MSTLELLFPVLGDTLPLPNGYALYAALTQIIPDLHAASSPISIGPISGEYVGQGLLRLTRESRLRCRLPSEVIRPLLRLAGKGLDVAGHRIRLGVPNIRALVPTETLMARLVVMNVAHVREPSPEEFLASVRRRLTESGITGEPHLPLVDHGPHAGKPRRRVLRLKNRTISGFGVQVTGLDMQGSLQLQGESPFGKRRMGCGFFVPVKGEEVEHEV